MKLYFKFYVSVLLALLFFSCERNNKLEIQNSLKSINKTEVIQACMLIRGEEDTIFVKDLFTNINDSRISHEAEFYGISVHEAKVKTLKRISGLNPPNKITYKVDTSNINFYKRWAVKNKYL